MAGKGRESAADADGELIVAARAGDVDRVRSLLERDADVDARDASGATALVAAAYGNHLGVARSLIDGRGGRERQGRDRAERLPDRHQRGRGRPALLELTLAHGADVNAKDSYNGTGLIRAADRGHAAHRRAAAEDGGRVDHVNRLGWTALLEAIILGDGGRGHTEVVRLLRRGRGRGEPGRRRRRDAVGHARRQGYDEIAAILQRSGGWAYQTCPDPYSTAQRSR